MGQSVTEDEYEDLRRERPELRLPDWDHVYFPWQDSWTRYKGNMLSYERKRMTTKERIIAERTAFLMLYPDAPEFALGQVDAWYDVPF